MDPKPPILYKLITKNLPSKFLVYALSDPRAPDDFRYIGMSSCGISRPKSHLKPSSWKKWGHRNNWLKSLSKEGHFAQITILLYEDSLMSVRFSEIFLIQWARLFGFNLTNQTDGGEGTLGYHPTDENRRRSSERVKGTTRGPMPEAWRQALSRARLGSRPWNKGIPRTEECKQKISKANKGKKKNITDETRRRWKISRSGTNNPNFGKEKTPEIKMKLLLSQKNRRVIVGDNGEKYPSIRYLSLVSGRSRCGVKWALEHGTPLRFNNGTVVRITQSL